MLDGRVTDGNIPTNLRLLAVIEAIAEAGVPVTATEVNQKLGLPKPTIHRLFTTLESEGYIQREIDGRGFSPGARLRTMSAGVLSSLRIRTARLAVLRALAEEIGETCNISLPDRDAMIYLDRVETKWPLRIQLPIGTRVPFYATASGKMYLSTLDDRHLEAYLKSTRFEKVTTGTLDNADAIRASILKAREEGHSTDDQEFIDGMIAVAVPIADQNDRMVATLSVHAPASRLSLAEAETSVSHLHAAAQQLSALLVTG